MDRFSRPAKTRSRGRSGSRQAFIALAFGACLGLGALAIDYCVTAQRQAAVALLPSDDDEIYTGSILYMPDMGNVCRQLLFDNQNGQFTDNGYVDCARAAYRIDGPKRWSAARVRVISDGFRKRQSLP